MTSRYPCILLIVFHTLLISAVYASPNIEKDFKENTMISQGDGSACRNVYQFFGDSSSQSNIKQYIEDAINTLLTRQNKSDDSSDAKFKALSTKIEALEGKIDAKLDRCTSNTSKQSSCIGNDTCHFGYVYYERDKFWYKFHNQCKSWSEAREVCQQEGGDLISLKESNFNFFKDMARSKADTCSSAWVGTTDISSQGQWYWLSGESVSSIFWGQDEPNNSGGNEHCGDLHVFRHYNLNDYSCSRNEHFICQKS